MGSGRFLPVPVIGLPAALFDGGVRRAGRVSFVHIAREGRLAGWATFLVVFVISRQRGREGAEMEMFVTSPCHHGRRQVVTAAAPKTTDQRS